LRKIYMDYNRKKVKYYDTIESNIPLIYDRTNWTILVSSIIYNVGSKEEITSED
jgi:hypothetical protein